MWFNFSVLVHIFDDQETFQCHHSQILAFISVCFDTVSDQSNSSIGSDWSTRTTTSTSLSTERAHFEN